ncbi:MAG: LLM class F420-dependent oxidoreductase [Chloroflexi bacterium]|nr:LLM class F420-dependent oxidoreductase [Chloroflexota bacterium]
MKYGFQLPQIGEEIDGASIARFARKVEEVGFHALFAGDHFVIPHEIKSVYSFKPGSKFHVAEHPNYLECYTLLTWAAAVTRRVRLCPSVMITPYRPPVIIAKVVASLDVLSGGRVIVGAGVGWMAEEFAVLGVPFKERGARTNEYLEVCKALWTQDNPHYEGRFYRVADLRFGPKPVQRPHPPTWIGGHSTIALERAVKMGQGWMPAGPRPAEAARLVGELHHIAEKHGRNPDELEICLSRGIEFTKQPTTGEARRPLMGTPEQVIEDLIAYQNAGVHMLRFQFRTTRVDDQIETIERLAAEVAPHVPRGPKDTP